MSIRAEIDDLSFRYKNLRRKEDWIFHRVSATFDVGGISAVVGPSGVGKSTLLALLAGVLLKSDKVSEFSGNIHLDSKPPESHWGIGGISWMTQSPLLLGHLSVRDNLRLPFTLASSEDDTQVDSLLTRLDLSKLSQKRPVDLSGGQKTRTCLARCLVEKPRFLFLDEPFNGLDIANRINIYKLLKDLRDDKSLATFFTTHDIPEAILLADRIIIVDRRSKSQIWSKENKHSWSAAEIDNRALSEARKEAANTESQWLD